MSKGNQHLVILEAKAHKRDIIFRNKAQSEAPQLPFYNVPFPYLVMLVKAKEQDNAFTVDGTRIYAMKGPLLKDDDMVYDYPYSNVYNEDGRVCWGKALGKTSTILHLSTLLNEFLISVMNNDLYNPLRSHYPAKSFLELLERLNTEALEEYPYSTLTKPKKFSTALENIKL